jgi:hypothetical protein
MLAFSDISAIFPVSTFVDTLNPWFAKNGNIPVIKLAVALYASCAVGSRVTQLSCS